VSATKCARSYAAAITAESLEYHCRLHHVTHRVATALTPRAGRPLLVVTGDPAVRLAPLLAEWAPDGRTICNRALDRQGPVSIWSIPAEGGSEARGSEGAAPSRAVRLARARAGQSWIWKRSLESPFGRMKFLPEANGLELFSRGFPR
jgi:hypothetical protein